LKLSRKWKKHGNWCINLEKFIGKKTGKRLNLSCERSFGYANNHAFPRWKIWPKLSKKGKFTF